MNLKWFGLAATAALTLAWPAQGAWFEKEPALPVVYDGTLSMTYPFADRLPLNPEGLILTAHYMADDPDGKGVERIMVRPRPDGGLVIPFPHWPGLPKLFEMQAVERTHVITKEWIVATGANRLEIRIPEYLPGPGKYSIRSLEFVCNEACAEAGKRWTYSIDFHHAGTRDRQYPPKAKPAYSPVVSGNEARSEANGGGSRLVLSSNASRTWTVDYMGPKQMILASATSYVQKRQFGLSQQITTTYETSQGADGVWHISPLAYEKSRDRDLCHVNSLPDDALPKTLRLPKGMARYTTTRAGASPGLCEDTPWSGCLNLEGKKNDGYAREHRMYQFVRGQPIIEEIFLDDSGIGHFKTKVEFDGKRQLLFFGRVGYNYKIGNRVDAYWNRLEHKAYPEEIGPVDPSLPVDQIWNEAIDMLASAREGCPASEGKVLH